MASKKTKNNDLTLVIKTSEIIGSEIMRNGDYKYVRVGVKRNADEYISISYEWKGDQVPEFALMLMQWIQANKEIDDEVKAKLNVEYEEFKKRVI